MPIKIAEAIGDRDGKKGESADNEIVIRTFKRRSYEFTQFLRCNDRQMAQAAVSFAERIALCPQFGYSQKDRWTGAKAIERVGADDLERADAGDFDCSSFVIESYRLAGCPLKMTGYTGSIRKLMLATGYFYDVDDSNPEYAEMGDIFNCPSKHALIVLTDGTEATPEPPQADSYVEIIRGKVNVRKQPAGKIYMVASKGDRFPFLGYSEPDSTGKLWWAVDCDNRICFISSENQKHAVLVEGIS